MRKLVSIIAVLAILLVSAVNSAGARPLDNSSTAEKDDQPCGEPYWHNGANDLVQDCPMWRGHVPVLINDKPVGYLENAKGNWFVCQAVGSDYAVPGTDIENRWYAYTMADNGEWGFVPEAYFSGGSNNQPDGNLDNC